MKRKVFYALLLFCISIWVFGQKPHADSFFISRGDTVRYSTIYTWKHSDVNWLKNERTNLFALVDSNLNVLTEFKYERYSPFYGKSTAVMRNGKWGIINKKGKEMIEFKYTMFPYPFLDTTLNKECYIFTQENKVGVIDASGESIIPFIWDEILYLNYAILELKKDSCNYLYFMETGKKIPIYSGMVTSFNRNGKAIIKDSKIKKYGVMDTSCTIIQPCIYNNIKEVKKFLE